MIQQHANKNHLRRTNLLNDFNAEYEYRELLTYELESKIYKLYKEAHKSNNVLLMNEINNIVESDIDLNTHSKLYINRIYHNIFILSILDCDIEHIKKLMIYIDNANIVNHKGNNLLHWVLSKINNLDESRFVYKLYPDKSNLADFLIVQQYIVYLISDYTELAKLLIDYGVNLYFQNNTRKTPLDNLTAKSSADTKQELIEYYEQHINFVSNF